MVFRTLDSKGLTPTPHLDIGLFVGSGRHIGRRQIGQSREQVMQLLTGLFFSLGLLTKRRFKCLHLSH